MTGLRVVSALLLCSGTIGIAAGSSPDTQAAVPPSAKLSDFGLAEFPATYHSAISVPTPEALPVAARDDDSPERLAASSEWACAASKGARVFALGETHHNRAISALGAGLALTLNTCDRFQLVSLEQPYSRTAFFQHYIGLSNDDDAALFRATLQKILSYDQELLAFLERVRQWNREHPKKKIDVSGHDIEHDPVTTVQELLVPYFQAAGVTCDVNSVQDNDALGHALPVLEQCARRARGRATHGFAPRVDAPFIASVVANLQSTWLARELDLSYYRQRAILRNFTDPAFLGKMWADGKLMLWAGAYHAASRTNYPDDGNLFREAAYLQHTHPGTKGRVYSVYAMGYGLILDDLAQVDGGRLTAAGGGYRAAFRAYTGAARAGLITAGTAYLFQQDLDDVDFLLLSAAARVSGNIALIRTSGWQDAVRADPNVAPPLKAKLDMLSSYDALIIAPQSPISRRGMKN